MLWLVPSLFRNNVYFYIGVNAKWAAGGIAHSLSMPVDETAPRAPPMPAANPFRHPATRPLASAAPGCYASPDQRNNVYKITSTPHPAPAATDWRPIVNAIPASNSETLAEALEGARQLYAGSNPASRARFERAQLVMPGGNTRTVLHFSPFPLYMARSEGAYLHDMDEHAYLDVLGEYTAGLYGHGHPGIVEEIQRTAARGLSNGAPGEKEIELAELMCARFPALQQVRFCNSGTEANLYALTLARQVTGRQGVLAFRGAYHGGVLAFPSGPSSMNVPFEWTMASYNDMAAIELIRREGARLAAVIIEPMLSNGGSIPATREFLAALRAVTEETGTLLVFDEVVTSRMGRAGMQGEFGIIPDLVSFGKYLGAGFSFGAFGGRADLMARFDPRDPAALGHAGTFNNNVFSMSVGAFGLDRIFTPERAQQLLEDGNALRHRLQQAVAAQCPGVSLTGYGSVMNIHFVPGPVERPEQLANENRGLLELLHFDLLEAGIYAARRGQINLSLPMGPLEFDRIVTAVSSVLERRRGIIEDAMAA